jgi:hypothetical protein
MHLKRLLYLIIIISIFLNLLACNRNDNVRPGVEDIMTKATEERFNVLEIREYKGIKLDSFIGPRDNSISGIQAVDIDRYALEVSGIINNPFKMSYDEVLALNNYEKLITLYCVEGWDATILWKGVLIKDIIALAEADEKADTVSEILLREWLDHYHMLDLLVHVQPGILVKKQLQELRL